MSFAIWIGKMGWIWGCKWNCNAAKSTRMTRSWIKKSWTKMFIHYYIFSHYFIAGRPKCNKNVIMICSNVSPTRYRARTNRLLLYERKKHQHQDTKCRVCNLDQDEDLEHFLLYCAAYQDTRKDINRLQQPYIEDKQKIMGELLFTASSMKENKENIYKM